MWLATFLLTTHICICVYVYSIVHIYVDTGKLIRATPWQELQLRFSQERFSETFMVSPSWIWVMCFKKEWKRTLTWTSVTWNCACSLRKESITHEWPSVQVQVFPCVYTCLFVCLNIACACVYPCAGICWCSDVKAKLIYYPVYSLEFEFYQAHAYFSLTPYHPHRYTQLQCMRTWQWLGMAWRAHQLAVPQPTWHYILYKQKCRWANWAFKNIGGIVIFHWTQPGWPKMPDANYLA